MKTYLVGGAVRDSLLSLPIKDKDFVVVGSTVEQMFDLGYSQVGKDFPVFLHPKTQQEYALARTERKNGQGYAGFSCDANQNVTLEEDLLRRDLTINAMAQDESGNITDPYGGQKDIEARVLRHVSSAFIEDPLRVLRVARFAARFAHLDFDIASETMALMTQITESGELEFLTPERVWQEVDKALSTERPEVFFQQLRKCGALAVLFPEIDCLFGVPQPEKWHPEIDSGIHTMMVLQAATKLSTNKAIRFAALVHDLGKGITPKELWPKHHGHGQKGLPIIKKLCQRLKTPNEFKELALLCSDQHQNIHNADELRPETIIKIFDKADFWRKPHRLDDLLICCQADIQGRTGFENADYPQSDYLKKCFILAQEVNVQEVIKAGFQGKEIKQQLSVRRIEAIKQFKQTLQAQT
ncbi:MULTISPECIES: multifunctional CCA addition/repair protein [Shewanella]|uniref:Multifunctional CCA protein n=1 Tax=Shewanella japonica TaxID=93973 RepID=A0ABN4YFC7_9GAMM|nr:MULTISPECIES: multifunctional CCA addition/repair protein [Shewanella]ARD21519.1 Multifunctional CCA protein [Shewanella japonica]KPZ71053.1 Multifunctional CCA protein [Shewanella sp. P1-14-1]OBT08980.1 multifunctional CCA tRNA nucleotidyl transferase/2'3'-cyclic phosphodiesterase/2'nucleotidase/phosphatase [Shewanella sp. UCD-FRSSP16_17]